MRQFYIPIGEALTKGLVPVPSAPNNGAFLSSCTNFKPMAGGLQAVKYTRSFSLNKDAQIFLTSYGTIVLTADTIYVKGATTLVPILTGFPGLCTWSIADFGLYIVLTNGTITLVYDGYSWSRYSGSTIPQANSICNAQGRAVLGGFSGYPNKVKWSRIGEMKFLDINDLDTLNNNTAGERFMVWDGEILAVLPLGPRAAVLGTGGVSFLVPASVEPFAYGTFGLHEVSPIGIGNPRGAVVTSNTLFYVNLNNELCVVTVGASATLKEELKQQVLGYSDFLDTETAKLSYDSKLQELYISQSDKTYIFTKNGLGSISGKITSVAFDKGSKTLLCHDADIISQPYGEMVSDVLDFGVIGQKTIEDLSLGGEKIVSAYGCVDYKNDVNSTWSTSPWRKFNTLGYCHIGITALQFRVHVKLT